MSPAELAERIGAIPCRGKRRLVAISGPPASGKSTLAEGVAAQDAGARVVPMDGFHLDNALLDQRGLRGRKGAHETFDAAGFVHLIRRLKTEEEVVFPLFDRALDKSINCAGCVDARTETIVVEGNYLLLDRPVWRDLAPLWDFTVHLNVPEDVLRARLMQRWRDHGFAEEDARAKTEGNDLPNAAFVTANILPADLVIEAE